MTRAGERQSPPCARLLKMAAVQRNLWHGSTLPLPEILPFGSLNQIFFEIPHFCQFVLRPNALGSPIRVTVTHSAESVSALLILDGNGHCVLGTSCRRLHWQLSFVAEILTKLSPLLSNVRPLTIRKGDELPSMEDMDGLDAVAEALSAIYSCDAGSCFGETTRTKHHAGSRHRRQGHGSITQAVFASPGGVYQYHPTCGRSC